MADYVQCYFYEAGLCTHKDAPPSSPVCIGRDRCAAWQDDPDCKREEYRKSTKKFLLHQLGGGQGCTLEDTDLWGLRDCLYHCLADGYLKENREWGEGTVERINKLRESSEK